MNIKKIEVKNFRLLEDISICLEERVTVIVGRNNSGKTSLTELFRRMLSDTTPIFRLEDFSLSSHDYFWNAFIFKSENRNKEKILRMLPNIEIKLTVTYNKEATDLGFLSDFIIDLNPDCNETLISIRYQIKDDSIDDFFENLFYDKSKDEILQRKIFFREVKERLKKCYSAIIFAEDVNDPTNQKVMEWPQLRDLVLSGFINAQRGLDDTTHKDINLLGKIIESLLNAAKSDSADSTDRDIVKRLEDAVESIQEGIDDGFNKQLIDLVPAFSLFGYPGLSDPGLCTETTLDVQKLLKDHTKVHYAGVNGVNLPEAYNGLGVRNLIYILLKLLEFFKLFISKEVAPGIHIVFIEEPEVHLHPQMQEVFIDKLNEITAVFSKKFNKGKNWPVQFVVTTHSSHIANRASFETIRYFLPKRVVPKKNIFKTEIKNLRLGLEGTPAKDREFLHKYMTLTRCDLLFADKAILIEGATERLLLPQMIKKIDAEPRIEMKLSSQYLSIVEVGGAHSHLFLNLLKFLELKTLIITDLDSIDHNDQRKASVVSKGTRTSNSCLRSWFDNADITPEDLLSKSVTEKTKELCRVAYEVPEKQNGPCGRSFEDAFILANLDMFGLDAVAGDELEIKAYNKARLIDKKTDFGLEYAILKTEWIVPQYICEGLSWLSQGYDDQKVESHQSLNPTSKTVVKSQKKRKRNA